MAGRPPGEKRKARCVMATDSEWQRIRDGAAAARLSISDHVVRVLLTPPSPPSQDTGSALPALVQRSVVRAVLALEWIERMRLEKADMRSEWDEIVRKVDDWLDGEGEMG